LRVSLSMITRSDGVGPAAVGDVGSGEFINKLLRCEDIVGIEAIDGSVVAAWVVTILQDWFEAKFWMLQGQDSGCWC
jgi:hypothetical protein